MGAMGTGQFSPLSSLRRPGRQRSSRSRDGKVKGWQSLKLCSQGCVTLSPRQHSGCLEVASSRDTSGGCLNSPGMQECWVPGDVQGCWVIQGCWIPQGCRDAGCCAHCRTALLPPRMATCPCSHVTLVGTGQEVQPQWVQQVSAAVPGASTDKGESSWTRWGSRAVRRRTRRWLLSWRDGAVILPMGPIIIPIW